VRVHRRESRLLLCELRVEVARVGRSANGREVWRRDALVVHVVKADVFEEQMGFDLVGVGFARTESASRVASQQLSIKSADVDTGALESLSQRFHSRAGEARQHPEAL
jgi:hypothetical protein